MFTIDDMNEIIKAALTDVASGMIKNASGYTGAELEKHLRDSFVELRELGDRSKKIAAELYSNDPRNFSDRTAVVDQASLR